MHLVAAYARLAYKRPMTTVAGARQRLSEPKRASGPPARLRERHRVTYRDVAGFGCWTIAPAGRTTDQAVLYLHGGAYVSEISPSHWAFISRLADAGVHVEAPIYGLAPQHTYRDAYPLVTRVYEDLVGHIPASAVTLVGDSAGGGLALGLAQTLADAQLPPPRRLVLIAPWLDLTLDNPAIHDVEIHDPMLTRVGLLELGRSWAGGDDPTGPRLSPVRGQLSGLPPIDVYVGSRDLFHPDSVRLQQLGAAQQVPVTVTTCRGGIHVYPLTPTPEGRAAATAIVAEIAGRDASS
jgi:epsilon-lactone hydrolase